MVYEVKVQNLILIVDLCSVYRINLSVRYFLTLYLLVFLRIPIAFSEYSHGVLKVASWSERHSCMSRLQRTSQSKTSRKPAKSTLWGLPVPVLPRLAELTCLLTFQMFVVMVYEEKLQSLILIVDLCILYLINFIPFELCSRVYWRLRCLFGWYMN